MSSVTGSRRLIGFKNDVSYDRQELVVVRCFPEIMMRNSRQNKGFLVSLGFRCNGLHGEFEEETAIFCSRSNNIKH